MVISAAMHYLAINAGSSSIKFALYRAEPELPWVVNGSVAGIGAAQGSFTVRSAQGAAVTRRVLIPEQITAVNLLLEWLAETLAPTSLHAIAHRIVHGAASFTATREISDAMLDQLYAAVRSEPDHLPQEVRLIDTLRRQYPGARHVASFDSTFHSSMPSVAHTLAIPRRYLATGLRRFGYHGLSCSSMMRELARVAGPPAAEGKVVLAHLGGGASVTAVHHGVSQDTTMGLSPSGGIPMGTRSGDIDPGLIRHFTQQENMSLAQMHHVLNHESGLLGVSGSSGDLQVLLNLASHDRRAAEAVELFVYQTRKAICAMAGALDGMETLIFAGGIGEHSAEVRDRICQRLRHLGVLLDSDRNAAHRGIISSHASAVEVRVMHTDEQVILVEAAQRLLNTPPRPDALRNMA